MNKKTYQVIKDMLQDESIDYVAFNLQETYYELQKLLENIGEEVPLSSHIPEKEAKEILKFMDAVKITHSWYSTFEIDVEKT